MSKAQEIAELKETLQQQYRRYDERLNRSKFALAEALLSNIETNKRRLTDLENSKTLPEKKTAEEIRYQSELSSLAFQEHLELGEGGGIDDY